MRPAERFRGAGIYILYYKGDFRSYAPISRTETPIYVGKAVPKGSRRGALGLERTPGYVLYERLAKHAESIEQVAPGLRLKDFNCQYLVVEDIFIPLGESLMIAMHPAGPIGARPWIAISLKQVRESLVPCTQAA